MLLDAVLGDALFSLREALDLQALGIRRTASEAAVWGA